MEQSYNAAVHQAYRGGEQPGYGRRLGKGGGSHFDRVHQVCTFPQGASVNR
ncbi:hypothetical protein [Streptomyces sp. DH10]|uniref:hypothetical protein n=1 Tax=Streptomyces sp. DH10 TaxID=3040121 RepID=UPI0024420A4D|nr:hypothetical protein [Streptomyces sp. DH10]MDG9707873.1 hypothetical protein [Streptomyces sp. DH10]